MGSGEDGLSGFQGPASFQAPSIPSPRRIPPVACCTGTVEGALLRLQLFRPSALTVVSEGSANHRQQLSTTVNAAKQPQRRAAPSLHGVCTLSDAFLPHRCYSDAPDPAKPLPNRAHRFRRGHRFRGAIFARHLHVSPICWERSETQPRLPTHPDPQHQLKNCVEW